MILSWARFPAWAGDRHRVPAHSALGQPLGAADRLPKTSDLTTPPITIAPPSPSGPNWHCRRLARDPRGRSHSQRSNPRCSSAGSAPKPLPNNRHRSRQSAAGLSESVGKPWRRCLTRLTRYGFEGNRVVRAGAEWLASECLSEE